MTAVCENYLSLDLAWLRRRKMLTPGRRSSVVWSVGGNRVGEITIVPVEDALLLVYRARSQGQAWQDHKQMVPFTTTATAFGGNRRWFACPQCTRPCRVLFGNGRFLCRRCWGIGYRSQRESRWSRTISRMHKLRARLGGSASLLEPFPLRPRYMRDRTYQTLRARYMSLSRQNTADLQGFVSRLKRRIGDTT
jgi:hypothetical protein